MSLLIYIILSIRKYLREIQSARVRENQHATKEDIEEQELQVDYQKYLNFKKIESYII